MKVFIENPAGSLVKHIHDEKTLKLKTTQRVSRAYPLPYGFLLNTTADDGDNVDCFVLTKRRLKTGTIVDCDAIGLMEQIEDGEVDHKVLAVIEGERETLDDDIKQRLAGFASHVFDHIPGKTMHIGAFLGREAALEYVRRHRDTTAAG